MHDFYVRELPCHYAFRRRIARFLESNSLVMHELDFRRTIEDFKYRPNSRIKQRILIVIDSLRELEMLSQSTEKSSGSDPNLLDAARSP